MSHRILQRRHRSQIFEKILKEDREGKSAALPRNLIQTASIPVNGNGSRPPVRALSPQEDPAALQEKGERAIAHGDFQTAADEFEKALAVAEESRTDRVNLVQLQLALGKALQESGKLDGACAAYERAQSVIDSAAGASMTPQQVEVHAHTGSLSMLTGDIAGAEQQLINAVNLYEEHCEVDPMRLSRLYLQLGSVYTASEHYDNAMQIVLAGLTFLEDCKEPVAAEKMAMFKHLAQIAYRKGESEAAVRHLLEAYRFAQEIDGQAEMITLEVTLATAYSQYGEFEAAAEWYQTAIQRQEAMETSCQWPLGLLYANLGQVLARQGGGDAAEYFSRSLDLQLSHLSDHADRS